MAHIDAGSVELPPVIIRAAPGPVARAGSDELRASYVVQVTIGPV